MKYFEFGQEHPELMVMLHGGGTIYCGMEPTAKDMLLFSFLGCCFPCFLYQIRKIISVNTDLVLNKRI